MWGDRKCNEPYIKKIVEILNKYQLKNGGGYYAKPEEFTNGRAVKVVSNGLTFSIYVNDYGAMKIADNKFRSLQEFEQILRKLIRLSKAFLILDNEGYVIDKQGIRYIKQESKKKTKRLKKLDAGFIYSNLLYEDRSLAELDCNKLNLINKINCSVVTTVDYWNKNTNTI